MPNGIERQGPKRVYKFCTYEIGLRVLKENRIKLSEFSDMNDPFELGGVSVDDFSPLEDVIEHFRETITALCLTTDWQQPLMWSHYADKYKGVCMGFDHFDPGDEEQELFYVNTIQPITDDLPSLLKDLRRAETVFKRILLTKFKAWEYEREIRILAKRDDKVDGVYFYDLNERFALKEIILGPRCDADVEMLMLAREKSVEVHRAALSKSEFRVVLDEPGDAVKRLAKMVAKAEKRKTLDELRGQSEAKTRRSAPPGADDTSPGTGRRLEKDRL